MHTPTFSIASPDLGLPQDQIHIWRASLDQGEAVVRSLEPALSADERARAERFHFATDRDRFIVARGVLRRILAGYLNREPAELRFVYGLQGKPSLQIHGFPFPKITFNLAHSHGQAIYAFAIQRELGVDVEMVRSDFPSDEIAERYFSAREIGQLLELPSTERTEAFFLGWTRKEAYVKAQGEGLHIQLNSFDVTLAPQLPAKFLAGVDSGWHLVSFFVSEHFPAALVHSGTKCPIKFFSALESQDETHSS